MFYLASKYLNFNINSKISITFLTFSEVIIPNNKNNLWNVKKIPESFKRENY